MQPDKKRFIESKLTINNDVNSIRKCK